METLSARLQELIDALNRGRLDVPNGLLDRDATYALNGRPYEALLGRDPNDPLIRLIARGPAGYRFAAQALIRALGNPVLAVKYWEGAPPVFGVDCRLSGSLRGSSDVVDCPVLIRLTTTLSGAVTTADVTIDAAVIAKLDRARGTD